MCGCCYTCQVGRWDGDGAEMGLGGDSRAWPKGHPILCVISAIRGGGRDVPFRVGTGIAIGDVLNHGLCGASFLFPSPAELLLFQLTLSSLSLTPLSLSCRGEEAGAAGGSER